MQELEPGRRIVSKGAYAAHLSEKASLFFIGSLLCILCFLLMVVSIGYMAGVIGRLSYLERGMLGIFWIVVFVLAHPIQVFRLGLQAIKTSKEINPGIPLTRAIAADLPAPDSLVRASQEPMQAQEGVLLRAATEETQPTDHEQLLRVSVCEVYSSGQSQTNSK